MSSIASHTQNVPGKKKKKNVPGHDCLCFLVLGFLGSAVFSKQQRKPRFIRIWRHQKGCSTTCCWNCVPSRASCFHAVRHLRLLCARLNLKLSYNLGVCCIFPCSLSTVVLIAQSAWTNPCRFGIWGLPGEGAYPLEELDEGGRRDLFLSRNQISVILDCLSPEGKLKDLQEN